MNTNDATRANAEAMPTETRDLSDTIDLLAKAIDINELILMAGESMPDQSVGKAIVTGSDLINDMLRDVKEHLYAIHDAEGGAA